jgi:hypothetical protein
VPDFQTTLTIRWAAPDDDAARDDVDRWLSQLTPGVDSVLVTPPGVVAEARAFFATLRGTYAQAILRALSDMDETDPEARAYAEYKLREWAPNAERIHRPERRPNCR